MTSWLLLQMDTGDLIAGAGLWLFLSIGALALFGIFLPAVSWMDNRRKEREAYYRAETLRRLAEASGEGAKAALELLREDARLSQAKKIEGLKIGGLINLGIGLALVPFMWVLFGHHWHGPALAGLIPAFMGLAMLVYVFFMAGPTDK